MNSIIPACPIQDVSGATSIVAFDFNKKKCQSANNEINETSTWMLLFTKHLKKIRSIFSYKLPDIVADSVISKIDTIEEFKNIPVRKYTTDKLAVIKSSLQQISNKIRVISYNILFNLNEDKLPIVHHWSNRLPRIVKLLEVMQPDVLCVQELYPEQLNDLEEPLGKKFSFFVGSAKKGELNGIFYNKERFAIDVSEKNQSIEMPFDDKDSAVDRQKDLLSSELEPGKMMTILHLIDKKTEKRFAVVNTHLTFRRIHSRELQAHFISLSILQPILHRKPVIFTGDLNTFPNRLDLEKLPFHDGDDIQNIFTTEGSMKNAREVALLGHIGAMSTSTNDPLSKDIKPFTGTGNPGVFTDHIYVSKGIDVIVHGIETAKVGGEFPSDHMPVLADCLIGQKA